MAGLSCYKISLRMFQSNVIVVLEDVAFLSLMLEIVCSLWKVTNTRGPGVF